MDGLWSGEEGWRAFAADLLRYGQPASEVFGMDADTMVTAWELCATHPGVGKGESK